MRARFEVIGVEELVDLCVNRPTVLLAAPNYEERSVGFLEWFLDACSSHSIDPSRVFTQLLWPQGTSTRVELLEQLKVTHFGRLKGQLERYPGWRRNVIAYPNDFNNREVLNALSQLPECFPGEPHNLVVDISCMPKRVLFSVCEGIQRIVSSADAPQQTSVFFVYTSPKKYAALRYAQNVGQVTGLFSGCPIHQSRSEHVSAFVFPSLQGYEGKLLYDGVRAHVSSSVTAFISVSGSDYHTSLATMRANQFLMEQRDVDVVYYFSLKDGLNKLERRIEDEARRTTGLEEHSRMILVAPFGPKVFVVAAYFMLQNMQTDGTPDTEIAHVGGFQYLSLYSLGVSDFSGFRLSLQD